MNRKANVPIIILIALMLIFLSLASGGFYLFQKERNKNLELQSSLQDVNTKQKTTELKLKEAERIISDLQVQLKDSRSQIDSLNNDLQQEKSLRSETAAKLEKISDDLAQQKGLRQDLEKRLSQAQEEAKNAQAQLKELDSQKADLESKVKELESKSQSQEGVELGKILVNPEAAPSKVERKDAPVPPASSNKKEKNQPAANAGMEGKILVMNKEYNFAVINLGNRDGVEIGNVFSVYHNNKYLGDIKVEKVHDSMAAAGFVTQGIKDKINEGDKVVQKLK